MCAAAVHPRRVALTIGNNKYQDCPLTNCVNDATDLGNKLKEVGFIVVSKTDLNYEEMDKIVDELVQFIQPGDFVLFFYAGHGVQWEDQNYLVPCDNNKISETEDMKYRAINAQRLLERLSTKNPFVIIFLLDCCRDYWVANAARGRSMVGSSRGLAEMLAPSGSVIGFACAPGKTASDGSSKNRNGIYTKHILKHISKPGEEILMSLTDVTNGVIEETNGKQQPYTTSALRKRGIWLVPPKQTESNVSSKKALKHSSKLLVPTSSSTPQRHSPNPLTHPESHPPAPAPAPAPVTLSASTSHPPPHTLPLTPSPQGEESKTSLPLNPPSTSLVAPLNSPPTPLVAPLNPPPTPLVARLNPPPTSLVAPSYPPAIPLVAPSYPPAIPLTAPSYSSPTPLVAPSYPPAIPLTAPSYPSPTPLVAPLYPNPTLFVDPSYSHPTHPVDPSYFSFNFASQPNPFAFSPLLQPQPYHDPLAFSPLLQPQPHHDPLAFSSMHHPHHYHHHHHHHHHAM